MNLSKYETDSEIIQKYVKSSAFGKNKIIYLPLIIGIFLLFFILYSVYDGLIHTIGVPVISILTLIAILCFIAVVFIQKSILKKMISETKIAPICIAKKIYGNDQNNTYYCIYSTDEKRQDAEFINKIADKILSISSNTTDKTEKQVNELFKVDLAKPNEFAKKLPISFTEETIVWRKQFGLGTLPNEIQKSIEENSREFYVIAINPENAKFFKEIYK